MWKDYLWKKTGNFIKKSSVDNLKFIHIPLWIKTAYASKAKTAFPHFFLLLILLLP